MTMDQEEERCALCRCVRALLAVVELAVLFSVGVYFLFFVR